jgi:hypothetical protein
MPKNILFTLTCFLSREDKLIQTLKALRSIHKCEPNLKKYADIVVINECGTTSGQFLKKEFPWITKVIDKKSKNDCGQSGSLNVAIDMLRKNKKKYEFWLHWEESWICTKPFLKVCDEAMSLGVDQLHLTVEDFSDKYYYSYKAKLPDNKRYITFRRKYNYDHYKDCKRSGKELHNGSKKIKQNKNCKEDSSDNPWPLYTLQPAMDRVSKILNVGYFNQDPKFWPVHFELEFGYNWVMQPGGIVAAGIGCAKRQKGHRSFSLGD